MQADLQKEKDREVELTSDNREFNALKKVLGRSYGLGRRGGLWRRDSLG